MPTGVRTPVVSMSMRALMGMVQAFETPGSLQRLVHLVDQLVGGDVVRRDAPEDRLRPLGRPAEYHVSTLRHSVCGLSTMIVSIMENGAGSVDVSARPAFPSTRSHLGKLHEDAVLHLHQLLRLGHRNARQRGGHVQQRAFVERRHELRAELLDRPEP